MRISKEEHSTWGTARAKVLTWEQAQLRSIKEGSVTERSDGGWDV